MKRVLALIGVVIVLICALMPIMSYADYEGITSEPSLGQTRYYYFHPYKRIGISVGTAISGQKYYWLPDVLYFSAVNDSVLLYSDVMCSVYVDLKEDSLGKYALFQIIPDSGNTSVWSLDLIAELEGCYPSNEAFTGRSDRFTLQGTLDYDLFTYQLFQYHQMPDTQSRGWILCHNHYTVPTANVGLLTGTSSPPWNEDDSRGTSLQPNAYPIGIKGTYSIHGAFPAQLSYEFRLRLADGEPDHVTYAPFSMYFWLPNQFASQTVVIDDSGAFQDVGSFLDTSIGGFFDMQIFPHVTVGGLFFVILGVLLVVVFLRLFAGG